MNKIFVSLTFDDALECHLDVAMPILEANGFRGTFFANLNAEGLINRFPEWQDAVKRGHELGNHTIFHPAVSTKSYITPGTALENYTLDRMRAELVAANRWLSVIDGGRQRTFAYPCCNPVLGRPGWAKRGLRKLRLDRTRLMGWLARFPILDIGSREEDYSSILEEHFVAARIGGFSGKICELTESQRYKVPCVSGDGMDSGGMLAAVEQAAEHGNWLVFMFHGIGGGHHLSCGEDAFRELVDGLKKIPGPEILPFGDVPERLWKVKHA